MPPAVWSTMTTSSAGQAAAPRNAAMSATSPSLSFRSKGSGSAVRPSCGLPPPAISLEQGCGAGELDVCTRDKRRELLGRGRGFLSARRRCRAPGVAADETP